MNNWEKLKLIRPEFVPRANPCPFFLKYLAHVVSDEDILISGTCSPGTRPRSWPSRPSRRTGHRWCTSRPTPWRATSSWSSSQLPNNRAALCHHPSADSQQLKLSMSIPLEPVFQHFNSALEFPRWTQILHFFNSVIPFWLKVWNFWITSSQTLKYLWSKNCIRWQLMFIKVLI